MNTSQEVDQIARALIMAQGQLENPQYNQTATVRPQGKAEYSFDYVSLDLICDLIRPVMERNALCVIHTLQIDEQGAQVTTRLIHESGQWMETEIFFPMGKWNVTGVGSAMTYARRYSLAALFNFAAADDDDGVAADPEPETKEKAKKKSITPERLKIIKSVIKTTNSIEGLREYYKELDAQERAAVNTLFQDRVSDLEKFTDKDDDNGES